MLGAVGGFGEWGFEVSYHLGNPCIHCGSAHDDVEPGFCVKAQGLGANIRNIEYLSALLAENKKKAEAEAERLRKLIADQKTIVLRVGNGLDLEKINLAESIMFATDHRHGGEEWKSAREDAIKWFATGKAGYRGLKHEQFGTKDYDRWHGQRCDCEYGMGPRHGSMVFRIGLKAPARTRALTDDEKEAAIYYLVNLERVQTSLVPAS